MASQTININVNMRGARQVRQQLTGLQRAMKGLGAGIRQAQFGMIALGGAAVAGAAGLKESSDAIINLRNQTAVFSNSQEQAAFKLQDTIKIARDLNSTLGEVGQVYQRISLIQDGIGLDDATASTIVRNLATAVKLSGATAQEAEGALRQFAQGLAANRLSGQELNSVLEQTPLVAKILADSIGEPTSRLRELGEAGELTTEVLINAFGRRIPQLEDQLSRFTFTLDATLGSARRELTLFFGSLVEQSGAGNEIRGLLNTSIIDPLKELNSTIRDDGDEAIRYMNNLKVALGALAGAGIVGGLVAVAGALTFLFGGALAAAIAGFTVLIGGAVGALVAFDKAVTQTLEEQVKATESTITSLRKQLEGAGDPVARQRLIDQIFEETEKLDALRAAVEAETEAERKLFEQRKRNETSVIDAFISGRLDSSKALRLLNEGVGVGAPAPKRGPSQEELDKAKKEADKAERDRLRLLLEIEEERRRIKADLLNLTSELSPVIDAQLRAEERQAVLGRAFRAKQITDTQQIWEINRQITAELESQLEIARLAQRERELRLAGQDGVLTGGENIEGIRLGIDQAFFDIKQQITDINGIVRNGLVASFNLVTDSIVELATTGKANFASFGRAILKLITEIIVKLTIAVALQQLLAAAGGFFSGSAGGSPGGIGGVAPGTGPLALQGNSQFSAGSGILAPFRAAGGPVQGGQPVIVGERGRELFVPPTSGKIMSNAQISQGGGMAPQVTILNVDSMENTLDALGSEEGEGIILNVIQRNPDMIRGLSSS